MDWISCLALLGGGCQERFVLQFKLMGEVHSSWSGTAAADALPTITSGKTQTVLGGG